MISFIFIQSSEAVAAEIACGFAASLLFVLCNPWTGRPEITPIEPPPNYAGTIVSFWKCLEWYF